jgi:hypothetical protein
MVLGKAMQSQLESEVGVRTAYSPTMNLSSCSSMPMRYMKIPAMNFLVSLVRSDTGTSGNSSWTTRRTVALTRESPRNSMFARALPEAMLPSVVPEDVLDGLSNARRYKSHRLMGTCMWGFMS